MAAYENGHLCTACESILAGRRGRGDRAGRARHSAQPAELDAAVVAVALAVLEPCAAGRAGYRDPWGISPARSTFARCLVDCSLSSAVVAAGEILPLVVISDAGGRRDYANHLQWFLIVPLA